MDWDKGIEVTDDEGNRFVVTVAELQGLLMMNLTKDELDRFSRDLIIWEESQRERFYE